MHDQLPLPPSCLKIDTPAVLDSGRSPATKKFDSDDEMMDPIVDDDKDADREIEEEEFKPSKSVLEDLERLEKYIAALYSPDPEKRLMKRPKLLVEDEEKEEVEDEADDDKNDGVEIEEEEIKPSKLSAEDQERVKQEELEEELAEYFRAAEADEGKEEVEDEYEYEYEDEDEYKEYNSINRYEPLDEFHGGRLVKQDPVTYKNPEVLLAAQFALDEENKSKERRLEIVEIVEYSCKKSSFGGVIKHIILNARDDTVVNAYDTVVWVKGDGTFQLLVALTAVPGDKGEAESKEEKEDKED